MFVNLVTTYLYSIGILFLVYIMLYQPNYSMFIFN